jgi:hypothetical protein
MAVGINCCHCGDHPHLVTPQSHQSLIRSAGLTRWKRPPGLARDNGRCWLISDER